MQMDNESSVRLKFNFQVGRKQDLEWGLWFPEGIDEVEGRPTILIGYWYLGFISGKKAKIMKTVWIRRLRMITKNSEWSGLDGQ